MRGARPTLDFFAERLGFRVDAIYPADNSSIAVVSGYGVRLQLGRGAAGAPGVVWLVCHDPGEARVLTAPNGTRTELVEAVRSVVMPPVEPSFVVTEGPVPDYVHFHQIRFQMIDRYEGWVRAVYEDEGPPFVLEAGDCALQPPRIRYRVLECAPGMEVVEIGWPANHETSPITTSRFQRRSKGRGLHRLGAGSSFVLPTGMARSFLDCSSDLQNLGVAVPATFQTIV